MINLLDNAPSKFRTKKWVEINNDFRRKYDTNSQIKSKTSIIKSILCDMYDYNDVYKLGKGTITVPNTVYGNTIEMNQL